MLTVLFWVFFKDFDSKGVSCQVYVEKLFAFLNWKGCLRMLRSKRQASKLQSLNMDEDVSKGFWSLRSSSLA